MTYSLGIDIGAEITTSVIIDEHGRLIVLELGDGRIATASTVFLGDDGSTTVGDAAAITAAGGELTTDPMGVLARDGDGHALRGLIAHVLGRAAAAVGAAPALVGLVYPDDWDIAAQKALADVARAAGASSVVLVSDRVAVRHRVDDPEPVAALAAGAAVAASASVGPIVTREDIGEGRPTTPRAPARPAAPPVSVFDEADGEQRETRPAPAPPATDAPPSADRTTAMPVYRPAPPPRRDEPAPRWPILIVGLVTLVAVAAIVVLFVLAGGGSDDGSDAVASSTVTTSSVATTTAPLTSSSTTTTSTSSTSTSTTSTSTTTSSSTSTSSTTSIPVSVGNPGRVTLVETGLVLDTGPVLRLGDDGENVLASITGVLGEPDSDSGFFEVAFCFSPRSRFVRWAQLEVVVSEDADAVSTFTQWYVDGADDPSGLVTIDGLGVGATVGFLQQNYGAALNLVPAFEGSEAGIFAVTNSGSGGTFLGITESLEPEARIGEMWAGDECIRVFT